MENWKKLRIKLQMMQCFGLQTMAPVDDVHDDDRIDDEDKNVEKKKWFIIDHDSRLKICWDLFSNIVYLRSFFMTARTIAFKLEP